MGVQGAVVNHPNGAGALLAQAGGSTVGHIADFFDNGLYTVEGFLGDALALPGIVEDGRDDLAGGACPFGKLGGGVVLGFQESRKKRLGSDGHGGVAPVHHHFVAGDKGTCFFRSEQEHGTD
jgi:hypothetical protein